MKDVFIELQERFGQDFEYAPSDFSYEYFIYEKNKSDKSICCGGDLNKIASESGKTWGDFGLCPVCWESTGEINL